jgi:hypothetical protein
MGKHPFVRSVKRQEMSLVRRQVGSGEHKSRGGRRESRQLPKIAEMNRGPWSSSAIDEDSTLGIEKSLPSVGGVSDGIDESGGSA